MWKFLSPGAWWITLDFSSRYFLMWPPTGDPCTIRWCHHVSYYILGSSLYELPCSQIEYPCTSQNDCCCHCVWSWHCRKPEEENDKWHDNSNQLKVNRKNTEMEKWSGYLQDRVWLQQSILHSVNLTLVAATLSKIMQHLLACLYNRKAYWLHRSFYEL